MCNFDTLFKSKTIIINKNWHKKLIFNIKNIPNKYFFQVNNLVVK